METYSRMTHFIDQDILKNHLLTERDEWDNFLLGEYYV